MKNRFIITISDIHGSKQYSVHEIIKKVILFAILTFLLISVGTFFYIKFLNSHVDKLKNETTHLKTRLISLKDESEKYKKENQELERLKLQLVQLIEENTDKLHSMDDQLREVEEIIGIGPDMNASFDARIEQARIHELNEKKRHNTMIQKKITQVKELFQKNAKKSKIAAIQKALLLNSIPNGKPLAYKRIASKFGYRIHPVTKKQSFHAGLDLPAKYGTPIFATASGVVEVADKKGHYGNFILIAHSYGFKTAYGHLSRFSVKSGDYVNKGQRIGYVGSTGRSTGPHLHYEIRYLTKWVDPKPFMFWNLDNINYIADKIENVNWSSILGQTKKLIALSTK